MGGSWTGLIWGGLVRIFLVHHVTWSVNSACHLWGLRPYQTDDESRDNIVFGILAMGEGWHCTHHAFPSSARHGLRCWQIDVSYWIIRALALLGLAWNVKVPIRRHHGDVPFVLSRMAGVYDDYCHSIPLAHQIQRIYQHQFLGHLFPGHPSHGQAFVHLDDLIEALSPTCAAPEGITPSVDLADRRAGDIKLPGNPARTRKPYSWTELGDLCHPQDACQGRDVAQTVISGHEDPFLRPWMMDRAEDHYAARYNPGSDPARVGAQAVTAKRSRKWSRL